MIPSLSIVVIEPDTVTRTAIAGAVKGFGGQVEIAGTAVDLQTALPLMQKRAPDIVLLDVTEVERGVRETGFILTRWPHAAVFIVAEEKNPDWILSLVRAGAGEYLTKPVVVAELTEAIAKVGRQVRAGREGTEGKTISVYNPSGGMGTTTVAVNLAATLAAQGEKVALVDLNLFCGNVTSFLDITPRYTLASITTNMGRVDTNFLMSVMERHASGVHVLSGPAEFEESAEITPEHLQELLGVMRTAFTYTIIDTGGAVSGCNRATFGCSDHILYTTVLDLPSLKNAKRYLPALSRHYTEGRLKLVVNRQSSRSDIKVTEAEKILNTRAYMTIPNGYADVRASINRGEPLVTCSPRSPVTKAMGELAHLVKLESAKASTTVPRTP